MKTSLFILGVICLILITITAQAEVKLFEQENSYFQPFPNLTGGENQNSFNHQSNDLILNNKIWGKAKRTWNGQISYAIKKVTGTSNNNVFIWAGIHSVLDAVTDAKAHSRGNTKYFSGDGDWHMWKNCRDFSATMIVINFSRRIFIEKITTKEAVRDLICVGLIRAVVFNATMKVVKGGFSAYNDPKYNEHNITYWKLGGDGYIATGRWSTSLVDVGWLMGFYFLKTWKFD